MKQTTVEFKSLSDFKNRIASLWQNQEENEEYIFIFPDEETENIFNDLVKCFVEG